MSPPSLRLRHIHLPTTHPSIPACSPPYSLASRLQSYLRRRLLDSKDSSSPAIDTPPPTLISFSPLPIYTLGRRQTSPLTPAESARLRAPLHFSSLSGPQQIPVETLHAPRGGLTTYHGPGQIVLWPVMDLKSRDHSQFTVRCYSRLLENTTISTLGSLFGLKAQVTDDPGVWVPDRAAGGGTELEGELRKIAALGVHLRRHVSGLGTAINLDMDGSERGTEETNPWKRITACGLEGKSVTSVRQIIGTEEMDRRLSQFEKQGSGLEPESGRKKTREELVADFWAREFAQRIGVEGVEKVELNEVALVVADRLVDAEKHWEENNDGQGGLEKVDERERCYFRDLEAMTRTFH